MEKRGLCRANGSWKGPQAEVSDIVNEQLGGQCG